MTYLDFVHLKIRSEYSFADSIVRCCDVTKSAADDFQHSIGLADPNSLAGAVKFYQTAKDFGVKPIVGCQLGIVDGTAGGYCTLYAQDLEGYSNLCELVTSAWTNHKGPFVTLKDLNQTRLKRIIVLSGGELGLCGQAVINGQFDKATKYLKYWKFMAANNFYVEVQRYGSVQEANYVNQVLNMAESNGIPVVATHPVHFMASTDLVLHKIKTSISCGETAHSVYSKYKHTEMQCFQTRKAMHQLFKDVPHVLANAVEVATRCNLNLNFGKPHVPGLTSMVVDLFFVDKVVEGLAARIKRGDLIINASNFACYKARLMFEHQTLVDLGYCNYFLIVADFVSWAKTQHIPVGPGRGSGASSLLAFVLGITDVDPLQFSLLFERFLNPARVSMPDLDIDFCQVNRDKVIGYVMTKYGVKHTAQVSAFNTLSAKAAIKDVGRAMDISYTLVEELAMLVPLKHNVPVSIAEALKTTEMLRLRCDEDNEANSLIRIAQKVEGLVRNATVHAGGVLITANNITRHCPMYMAERKRGAMISQFDKDDIGTVGMTKFDLLGLTALTILNQTVQYIRRLIGVSNWSLDAIEWTDKATYQLLCTSNTLAVFQFESYGMQDALYLAKPKIIEDVIALVALYRPGPLSLMPQYFDMRINNKRQRFGVPMADSILDETYGVMIYQEQVMQIAQTVGGFTLGESDVLRKAISDKNMNSMRSYKQVFQERAKLRGVTLQQSDQIFDHMARFASYGFNKSHATAYAFLAFQTAWMKQHFPTEFLASNLAWSMHDSDRIRRLCRNCTSLNVTVLVPNINQSCFQFQPIFSFVSSTTRTISFGLGAIKGCTNQVVKNIIRAREDRLFEDIIDFCLRTSATIITRRVLELLVKAGAFDEHYGFASRYKLVQVLPMIVRYINCKHSIRQASILAVFQLTNTHVLEYMQNLADCWSKEQTLREERKVLGFFHSDHPFKLYKAEMKRYCDVGFASIKKRIVSGSSATLCGIVILFSFRFVGLDKIFYVTLEDDTDQCVVSIKEKQLQCVLELDQLLIVKGRVFVSKNQERLRVIAVVACDVLQLRAKPFQFVKS